MTRPNIVLSNPEHYSLTEQKITEDGDNFLVQVKVAYDSNSAAHCSVDRDAEKWITEDVTFEIPISICKQHGRGHDFMLFQLTKRGDSRYGPFYWSLDYEKTKEVIVIKTEAAFIKSS